MIKTASGRPSRIVKQQLWLIAGQAVNLFGWMIALVPPAVAPWIAGALGTAQAISAIVLRQSTSEPMARAVKAKAEPHVEVTRVDGP